MNGVWETRLKLTGFLESVRGEPSFLLQIQWTREFIADASVITPPDDPVYSYLHCIPYSSFPNFPPSELDLSRYFSAADFSVQCSLYLAPKIASFISDIVYSLHGSFQPSLLIFAQLHTLDSNLDSHRPTEQLIPPRQDPHHQPPGAPLRSCEFLDDILTPNSFEQVGYFSERNGLRSRGACLPDVARLKEPQLGTEDSETKDCSICLQEMSADEELFRMACQHIFHENCMLTWLESTESCPLCRFHL